MNDFSRAIHGVRYTAIQQLASGVQSAFDRLETNTSSDEGVSSLERCPEFGATVAVIADPHTAGETVLSLLTELEQPLAGMGVLLVPSATPSNLLGSVSEGLKKFGVVTRRSKSNEASEMKVEARDFLEEHKARVLDIEHHSKVR
jgi:hypothetical protein